MSYAYCEYPEFYSETFPKSRKTLHCEECCAPIEIGEKHLYYRGKWDGEFDTGRQHMICRELCMFIRDNFQSGECFRFGDLKEVWSELRCGGFNKPRQFSQDEKKARALMAKIKWRERPYMVLRKRVDGVLMSRKRGFQWEIHT